MTALCSPRRLVGSLMALLVVIAAMCWHRRDDGSAMAASRTGGVGTPESGRLESERGAGDATLGLLQELRELPGVQVLFAFLLTVPSLSASGAQRLQEWLYFAVMITVALATVMRSHPPRPPHPLPPPAEGVHRHLSNTLALVACFLGGRCS